MENMIRVYFVSDCCGVETNSDVCVCSRCGEHCEVVVDDSLHAEMVRDYMLGLDDGEWLDILE